MRKLALSFVMAGAALASSAASAATISTLADRDDSVFSWGLPNTGVYGQTFQAGSDNVLNSFSFVLEDEGSAVAFNALIFAWDTVNNRAMGPELFRASGSTGGSGSTETITINTGNLGLSTGVSYVAFFQALDVASLDWGSVSGSDVYADGDFVFLNNGSDESAWTNGTWSVTFPRARDLAFELAFAGGAPVPLPAAALFMGAGLAGLAGTRRAKRKAA